MVRGRGAAFISSGRGCESKSRGRNALTALRETSGAACQSGPFPKQCGRLSKPKSVSSHSERVISNRLNADSLSEFLRKRSLHARAARQTEFAFVSAIRNLAAGFFYRTARNNSNQISCRCRDGDSTPQAEHPNPGLVAKASGGPIAKFDPRPLRRVEKRRAKGLESRFEICRPALNSFASALPFQVTALSMIAKLRGDFHC